MKVDLYSSRVAMSNVNVVNFTSTWQYKNRFIAQLVVKGWDGQVDPDGTVGRVAEIGEPIEVRFSDFSFPCTIVDSKSTTGGRNTTSTRVINLVGGKNGIIKTPKKGQTLFGTSLVTCIRTLLEDREDLGDTINTTNLPQRVDQFQIFGNIGVNNQLTHLLNKFDLVWRIGLGGKVEVYPADNGWVEERLSQDFIEVENERKDRSKTYSVAGGTFTKDDIAPGFLDERSLDRFNTIRFTFFGNFLRVDTQIDSEVDLWNESINGTGEYFNMLTTSHSAKVIGQAPNGRLNIRFDKIGIFGNSVVEMPLSFGVPGVSITVNPGVRCFVSFIDADPTRPYVSGFAPENGTGFVVTLGPTRSSQFVALSNLVDARITTLQQKLDAFIEEYKLHAHPSSGTAPPGTTPPVSTLTPVGSLATTAASKLKTS